MNKKSKMEYDKPEVTLLYIELEQVVAGSVPDGGHEGFGPSEGEHEGFDDDGDIYTGGWS